jgi:hypothetical protein
MSATSRVGRFIASFAASSDLESAIRLLKMFMGQPIGKPLIRNVAPAGNGFGV